MRPFQEMLRLIGPQPFPAREMSTAERLLLAGQAFAFALALIAVWGVAAGSCTGHIALANTLEVPVLLLVSAAAGLPLGLLLFRLTVAEGRASDLVLGHAGATFAAAMVLAFLAPIVALYQFSSVWAGPVAAVGSALVAALVGLAIFRRSLGKLVPDPGERRKLYLPIALLCALQGAALLQLAAIAPPIFPHRTIFGRGVDIVAPPHLNVLDDDSREPPPAPSAGVSP